MGPIDERRRRRAKVSSRWLACLAVAAVVTLTSCGDDEDVGSPQQPPTTSDTTPEPSAQPACDDPCYGQPHETGQLTDDVVTEVSGMAASRRTPGMYYVVSDEPGTSAVAIVGEDGESVARLAIEGMDPENAEALAVGPCGDDSCLYVGDIGDHVGRPDVVVYRVPEPDLNDPPASVAADELRYIYPDTWTDAEALIVDDAGRPLIVTKARFDKTSGETGPTKLYRGDPSGGELTDLGVVKLPKPKNAVFAQLTGNVVTDASRQDGSVLLRTYDEVIEYRAADDDADVSGFPQWERRRVPSPNQLQSETVAHRTDGCGYLTTSELTGAIAAVSCAGS